MAYWRIGMLGLFLFCGGWADSEWMPLEGTTWMVTDDRNRNIGTTMADVRANTVIIFSLSSGKLSGAWANLTGMSFLSVGEASAEIMRQFRLPDHIFQDEPISLPDDGGKWSFTEATSVPEAYSCADELKRIQDLVPGYFKSISVKGRTTDGKDVSYSAFPPENVWFVEPPDCVMNFHLSGGFEDYSIYCKENEDGENICRHSSPEKKVGNDQDAVRIIENTWCNLATRNCAYEVDQESMKTSEQGLQTWNFQLYPRIVWHPRNILDGQPIRSEWLVHFDPVTRNDLIKNNEKDALFMIEKSRNSSDPSIKGWRDPILSDSLSALLSFQFSEADVHDSVIVLRDRLNGMWDRSPWRAALISNYVVSPTSVRDYDIGQALLRIFAESVQEIEIAGDVNYRCGNSWITEDSFLGRDVFEFQDTTISNAFVPLCTEDTPYGQPCAKDAMAYAVQVKRIKFRTDSEALEPSMAIWRDGCPDPRPSRGLYRVRDGRKIHLNRNETLRWLHETPPRCSLRLLNRLFMVYDAVFKNYKNDEDKTLAKAAWAKAGFTQSWIKRIEAWKAKDPNAVEEWDHCETAEWEVYGWDR